MAASKMAAYEYTYTVGFLRDGWVVAIPDQFLR